MATYQVPDELTVDSDGPIRIVTMNNPSMRNAFTRPLHHAMVEIWPQISADREARAVILTGAGRAFSAGGDVANFIRNHDDPDHRRESLRGARHLIDAMLAFPLPIVAAVNGPAVGLGCSVALLCDLVLIDESTFMADPHVNMGLVAGDGGAMIWPFVMSILKAKEFLLTGRRIPAKEAVELGLASRSVAPGGVMEAAWTLARELADQPPQAVQETKRALNIHLQQAAAAILPFALGAEAESFGTEFVRARAEQFRAEAQ